MARPDNTTGESGAFEIGLKNLAPSLPTVEAHSIADIVDSRSR